MENTAKKILAEIMNYRRIPRPGESCGDSDCPKCSGRHLPQIISAVQKHEPVVLVLPAFPGKSPNPEKVLGPLPDLAERLSLQFFSHLGQRVKEYYPPGIKIILCSDGRVFSDVVGIKESNVSAYHNELKGLIREMELIDVTTFNLEDVYGQLSFIQMRDELMKCYGISLEVLKHKVRNGSTNLALPDELEAHRMYCGITRFLFDDATHSGQIKSRSAIQKESRIKAYEVIRRSNAWSELIAEHFPEAIRLSIHPQICGSAKLGIQLIGKETWMTPWHGVAVETMDGHVLLKRYEAEALGAQLVYSSDGRPSHYTFLANQSVAEAEVSYAL